MKSPWRPPPGGLLIAGALIVGVAVAGCSSSGETGDASSASTSRTEASASSMLGSPNTTTPDSSAANTTSAPSTTESTITGDGTTAKGINPDGVDPLPPIPDEVALPIVFVHGFAGSAQQYESQKIRFVANGYPADRIVAYEHDGAGMDVAAYVAGLAAVVDTTLEKFDVAEVYLVGHSRGTLVSGSYLEDPAMAANVAKYVAIDGAPCPTTAAVPCVAPNQTVLPGQSHVETATSPESFAMQYAFLVGAPPQVIDIVPQREPVVISGRAVNFPANTGRDGVTLEIWPIDADTGHRSADGPVASEVLDASGDFGPVEIESGAHYEFLLTTPGSDSQHHLYLQPYVRSSDFVRLLSSPPDGTTRVNTNTGDAHSAIIAMRMREWYAVDDADLPGDERDVLEISTNGDDVVNSLAEFVGNSTIGMHVHDDATSPASTTLAALPNFAGQPFQSGVDIFMPSSADGSGTITIVNMPRGDRTRPQTLNVPDWPSSTHAISVVFTDSPVD